MVTGHEEAIAVLRAPDVFSSATIVAGPDPMSLFPQRPARCSSTGGSPTTAHPTW